MHHYVEIKCKDWTLICSRILPPYICKIPNLSPVRLPSIKLNKYVFYWQKSSWCTGATMIHTDVYRGISYVAVLNKILAAKYDGIFVMKILVFLSVKSNWLEIKTIIQGWT